MASSCRLLRDRRGTAVVEFIVALPLFLAFVFIVIETGHAIWYHHIVTNGVRDGVRYLARAPLTDEYIDNARWIAMTGRPVVGGDPTFAWWADPTTVDVQITPVDHSGQLRTNGPINVIRMTAEVPITLLPLGFGLFREEGDEDLTIRARDEARHIGE